MEKFRQKRTFFRRNTPPTDNFSFSREISHFHRLNITPRCKRLYIFSVGLLQVKFYKIRLSFRFRCLSFINEGNLFLDFYYPPLLLKMKVVYIISKSQLALGC